MQINKKVLYGFVINVIYKWKKFLTTMIKKLNISATIIKNVKDISKRNMLYGIVKNVYWLLVINVNKIILVNKDIG